ncbi:MAG TPA: AmmeMemoRadiSam system protein A [Candidatus Acidoferrum sp.]|nr:AmmeMemoRadiSam system protein A [Candidatus Acidoferrum sp.]
MSLSKQERTEILQLARESLREAICHKRQILTVPDTGIFGLRRGAFVSLHLDGKLRGCIGIVEPAETLGRTIAECAVSAAREDPRFAPLRPEETENVQIEVSVLTPPAPIAAEDVSIGEHGLLIEQGARRGLLLPQVAVEHGLDRERFLQETCRKAGLPLDAWKSKETRIFGFRCEIIGPLP